LDVSTKADAMASTQQAMTTKRIGTLSKGGAVFLRRSYGASRLGAAARRLARRAEVVDRGRAPCCAPARRAISDRSTACRPAERMEANAQRQKAFALMASAEGTPAPLSGVYALVVVPNFAHGGTPRVGYS
jgi:hypothetical protein